MHSNLGFRCSAWSICLSLHGCRILLNHDNQHCRAGLIPYMPYFPALMVGISLFGLAILSAIDTFYLFMYAKQWGKIYLRWCENIANDSHYPQISKHPKISKKTSTKIKFITMIGLVCFVTALLIGFISMCIASSNSMQPWHIWHWFK